MATTLIHKHMVLFNSLRKNISLMAHELSCCLGIVVVLFLFCFFGGFFGGRGCLFFKYRYFFKLYCAHYFYILVVL